MSKDNKADLLVLGNVITMDEHKPRAQAVAVKADKIVYVGSAEVAKTLCADTTTVLDFGANFVYPGFLEAHCHPTGAGGMITLAARMTPDDSPEECVQIMREFMDAHPNATLFRGMGFLERDTPVHARMLDAICPDKPMVITDCSGHNMWLNSCALEAFDIDREAIDLWGTDCVRVDEDGKPSGYLSEGPVFHVRSSIAHTLEELEGALLSWQDYALSRGFTGVYNAGVNLLGELEQEAYHALEESGQLKHYVFAGYTIQDNTDTPERDIQEIAAKAAAYNSRHFELTGANISCDGTLETHTAWLANEYPDRPGYHGVTRFDDHDKIVRLVKAAAAAGLNVHVHTAGDAAVTTWVNGIAEAEEQTSNFDMRNALVHLQMASPEDIGHFGEYNIVAAPAMIRAQKSVVACPARSFQDAGAVVVFHSDFPASPTISAAQAIRSAVRSEEASESLSRTDALKAITINVAYSWHAEDRMGSLEMGKIANLTVFDKDFIDNDLADIEQARCLATFVDGELVFEA